MIGDQSRAAAIGRPGASTSTAGGTSTAGPSTTMAGPSTTMAGPSTTMAGPSTTMAGPSTKTAGRATPAAGTGASAAAAARAAFPDWRFAPNIGGHPGIYEIENRALDPDGHVLAAMRNLAPWDGRVIVDLGCGTGFWLPVYAADASRVIGVEPDPALRARAAGRTSDLPAVRVLPGSAEHLPLPDRSADVVHARFAYFLTPGGDAGLAEVLRVLRPGGSLVVVDNDHHWGQFAELLAAASSSRPASGSKTIDDWWRDRGATRHAVRSEWRFASRADLRAVLRIEFPDPVTDAWLARNPVATGLTYGYVLFAVTRPGPPARDRAPASRPADLRAAGRAGS